MLAPIEDAASRLRDRGIKRLPVVADGEAVVIVDSIPTVGPRFEPPGCTWRTERHDSDPKARAR